MRGTDPRIRDGFGSVGTRTLPICHGSGTLVSALLEILDVYTRGDSDFLPFKIPDLGSQNSDLGSRIPDLGSRISDTGSNKNKNEEVGKNFVLPFFSQKFTFCKLF